MSNISNVDWLNEPFWFLDDGKVSLEATPVQANEEYEYNYALIKENEGLRLTVYDDATGKPLQKGDTIKGYPTIGYGRELSMTGITKKEAGFMLEHSVGKKKQLLLEELREHNLSFWGRLSRWRKHVLIDMAYNLGVNGLMQFRSMMQCLVLKDYNQAATEIMDSAYFDQTGTRAKQNYCIMKFNKYYTDGEAVAYFEEEIFNQSTII